MKLLFLALVFAQASFANTALKLDYACRIVCSESRQLQSSYGVHDQKSQARVYLDFQNITRNQFDDSMTRKSLVRVCLSKLGEGYSYESHDCEVFKH